VSLQINQKKKKKPPTIKEKKRHKPQKEKINPITKNKKNKQTTTTTRETKCERQPKTTQVSLHKVKLLRANNKNLHKFLHKTMSIIL